MRLVNFYVCVVAIHLAPVTQPSPVTSVPPGEPLTITALFTDVLIRTRIPLELIIVDFKKIKLV